jgi:hypothetical protein
MGQFVDVEALARRQGFTVVTVVKEDYDHNIYVVEQDGQQRVLKTITKPRLRRNLAREIAYLTLLATLASADSGWTIRVGVPLATGDGWILRDLVAAPPLLCAEGLNRSEALARVGHALADLDRLSPDAAARRPAYRDEAGEPVVDEAHRMAELNRWVRELDARDALGALDAGTVLRQLADGRAKVQPGFEVWDVKFDDFLDLPDQKVGIYDLEFAHLFGRRHYDVARLYGTLAVPFDAAGPAAELLRTYLTASSRPVEAVAPACLPVLTEALLAELYDATLADEAARQTRAREQLARALTGNLDALIAG